MTHDYFRRRRQWLPVIGIFVLILAVLLHGGMAQPIRSSQWPDAPVPVLEDPILGTKPDWAQITFQTLPAVLELGSFEAPSDLVSQLGYDPSRIWQAGQTADQYMLLGDFQDSFQLQRFSLYEIAALVGLDIEALRLADFALTAWQTIGDLTKAIPDLESRQIQDVAPVADLLAGKANPQDTFAEVIQEPTLADLSLGELDLAQYDLNAIPGILDAPLDSFQDWQQAIIEAIPGLADVPFANFPNPIAEQGVVVGMVDVVFGAAEADQANTISGRWKGLTSPVMPTAPTWKWDNPSWWKAPNGFRAAISKYGVGAES